MFCDLSERVFPCGWVTCKINQLEAVAELRLWLDRLILIHSASIQYLNMSLTVTLGRYRQEHSILRWDNVRVLNHVPYVWVYREIYLFSTLWSPLARFGFGEVWSMLCLGIRELINVMREYDSRILYTRQTVPSHDKRSPALCITSKSSSILRAPIWYAYREYDCSYAFAAQGVSFPTTVGFHWPCVVREVCERGRTPANFVESSVLLRFLSSI